MHFVFYFIERDFFWVGGFHIFLLPLLCVFCAGQSRNACFFFSRKKRRDFVRRFQKSLALQ